MLRGISLLVLLITSPAFSQGYEAKYDMIWSVGIKLEAEAIETLQMK